jgi:hypothetical protein
MIKRSCVVVWTMFPGRGVMDWGEGVVIDTEQGGVGDGNDPLVKNEPHITCLYKWFCLPLSKPIVSSF